MMNFLKDKVEDALYAADLRLLDVGLILITIIALWLYVACSVSAATGHLWGGLQWIG